MTAAASIIVFAVLCLTALGATYTASARSVEQSSELEPVDGAAFQNLLAFSAAELEGIGEGNRAELRREYVLAHRDYLRRICRNAVRIQRAANAVLLSSGSPEKEPAQVLVQKATVVRLQALALLAGTYVRFTTTDTTSNLLTDYSTLRSRAAAIR
jgi:hypothetical protein